jgi:hypothetical protein
MIYKNLIHKFEYTIRELLGADMTEQEIYSLVSLTLNDWLVDGEFSQDYQLMAAQAIELREQMARETAQADVSPIVDITGTRIAREQ